MISFSDRQALAMMAAFAADARVLATESRRQKAVSRKQ
jgi:hypothetical protein